MECRGRSDCAVPSGPAELPSSTQPAMLTPFPKRKMIATQQVPCANTRHKKRGGQVCRAKHVRQADKPGGVVQDMPPVDYNQAAIADSHAIWRLHPAIR